ncbi:heme anaerobic degradation radical SAM methyltransferase ChuW/HutW [Psychromonas ossibalaenae]|uniref:heme anaerobic degradation radical SAM methyltransferase ChuW/HutW n=1 Tax=Psychromonas ossibalaenae TaxID=444922 RepID=UPI0003704609|nr:heme anaerobic degradation radical SAM methyltransferase ChuW/HutW [Psychromonas ossibalaenae]
MKNKLNIKHFNEDITGISTPSPLQFAFCRKKSAHAGGRAAVIPKEEQISRFEQALKRPADKAQQRCLYIHIPFCRVRCTYCNFFQHAASKTMIADYFAALLKEIKWKAQQPWTQSAPFQAVYVGGGTPTDLSAEQLLILGKTVRSYFPLTPDCEITLEGRINRFDDRLFENALEGGFNRFSFGVQSFNTKVRRSAKRLDDREPLMSRLQELSALNATPIVIDLLYGLPYQTMDIWKQDLEDFLESGVHGVDLYQLVELGGMPMQSMVEKGTLPAPADTAAKAKMFEYGVHFMRKHHIKRLSVGHWATSNRERSIYNSLAKTTAAVLPLGCGAGGNVNGLAVMQDRTLENYLKSIERQQHSVAMLSLQSADSAVHKEITAAFDRGVVSRAALLQVSGSDLFEYCLPLFEEWQSKGLVEIQQDYLTLTLAGQFWAVTLAQNLITVLSNNTNNKQQHAAA